MDLKYRDILVYNTFRTDSEKLTIFNVFDNVYTYSNSVKAIEQFKKDKNKEKGKIYRTDLLGEVVICLE